MKRLAVIFWLALLRPALAGDVAVALTDDLIEVDASFSGAEFVLFGAVSPPQGADQGGRDTYDIIATVRGPKSLFTVRPIARNGLIWTPGPATRMAAPGLLLTRASRPLEEIAAAEELRAIGVGADAQRGALSFVSPNAAEDAFANALLADLRRTLRFASTTGDVSFRKGALFSIKIALPPTTPVGDYAVDVFLFDDGALLSRDAAALTVRKVGIERRIYDLAHGRPLLYGVGCVIISLVAGWLAAAAFRK